MIPVIRALSVTSKAKLKTGTWSGVIRAPPTWVTSSGVRSSMGMSPPSAVSRSKVELGAAT